MNIALGPGNKDKQDNNTRYDLQRSSQNAKTDAKRETKTADMHRRRRAKQSPAPRNQEGSLLGRGRKTKTSEMHCQRKKATASETDSQRDTYVCSLTSGTYMRPNARQQHTHTQTAPRLYERMFQTNQILQCAQRSAKKTVNEERICNIENAKSVA